MTRANQAHAQFGIGFGAGACFVARPLVLGECIDDDEIRDPKIANDAAPEGAIGHGANDAPTIEGVNDGSDAASASDPSVSSLCTSHCSAIAANWMINADDFRHDASTPECIAEGASALGTASDRAGNTRPCRINDTNTSATNPDNGSVGGASGFVSVDGTAGYGANGETFCALATEICRTMASPSTAACTTSDRASTTNVNLAWATGTR